MTFYSSERRAHKLKKKDSNMLRNTPSNKQKARQKRKENLSSSLTDEEVMHQIIETLSEKLDEFHHIMDNTTSQVNHNLSPTFESSNETRTSLIDSEIEIATQSEAALEEDLEATFQDDRVLSGSSNAANNSVNAGSIIAHQTSFNYAPSDTPTYRYGFTNSEFFAFIANLDPVEYVIIIAIITIIIGVQLNVFEKQVISGALVDIGVSLGNMVEQELFQSSRQNEINNRERNQAEQTDFDTLYEDVNRLQAQINTLKEQLGIQ